MRLAATLAEAVGTLKAAKIDNPQLDAHLLFGYVLGLDRAQLLSQSQRVLTGDEIASISALIARRGKYEPVARIMGSREFWSLNFGLNEATLEPRPDSETLVEAVLKLGKPDSRILDLGTGTGCLLLSLLHEWQDASGLGIDISPRAVEQATMNADALGLSQRATFCMGNWLDGITEKFDVIVSNPPYIAASDIPALMPEVRDYDPKAALDGGADGLAAYRLLIPQISHFLKPQGVAAFEVGQGQAQQVIDLFKAAGFSQIAAHKDLGGIERCVSAKL